jgi:hypothetical protein
MSDHPLKWISVDGGPDADAHQDRTHYQLRWRSITAGGGWILTVFSMHTDQPGGPEDIMGTARFSSPDDAKAAAQLLANIRGAALLMKGD